MEMPSLSFLQLWRVLQGSATLVTNFIQCPVLGPVRLEIIGAHIFCWARSYHVISIVTMVSHKSKPNSKHHPSTIAPASAVVFLQENRLQAAVTTSPLHILEFPARSRRGGEPHRPPPSDETVGPAPRLARAVDPRSRRLKRLESAKRNDAKRCVSDAIPCHTDAFEPSSPDARDASWGSGSVHMD